MVDIFTRVKGKDPVWLEAVDDQAAPWGRLIVLCATEPGDYFAGCEAEIISEVSSYEEPSVSLRPLEEVRDIPARTLRKAGAVSWGAFPIHHRTVARIFHLFLLSSTMDSYSLFSGCSTSVGP